MFKKFLAKVTGDSSDSGKSAATPLAPTVRMRLPFDKVGLVAYDPVLRLAAITPFQVVEQEERLVPPNLVYIVGAENTVVEMETTLDQHAILLDMKFIPGTHQLVLLTTSRIVKLNFGQLGSSSASEKFLHSSLSSPLGNARLSAMHIMFGLPYVAVGRTDGVVGFADLFRSGWSETNVSLPNMLAAVGMNQAINIAKQQPGTTINTPAPGNAAAGAFPPLWSTAATTCPSPLTVTAIDSYPSDPNACIGTMKGFPGIVKWYMLEKRVSALFMLPLKQTKEAQRLAEEITSIAVTGGGGYVIGGTSVGIIYAWYEKGGKGSKDRVVTSRFTLWQPFAQPALYRPIRHITLYRSPHKPEAVLLSFVHDLVSSGEEDREVEGSAITELDVLFHEKKEPTFISKRLAQLPQNASTPRLLCCVTPIANGGAGGGSYTASSPWTAQVTGPPLAYLVVSSNTFKSTALAFDPTAPAGGTISDFHETVIGPIVCAPPSFTDRQEQKKSLYPSVFMAPCFAPSIIAPAPPGRELSLHINGSVSPFALYAGHHPNDRAFIMQASRPDGSCLASAKLFPHTGIMAPLRAPTLIQEQEEAPRITIPLFGGMAKLQLHSRSLSIQWLMGSDTLHPPPAEVFSLQPAQQKEEEESTTFSWEDDESCVGCCTLEGIIDPTNKAYYHKKGLTAIVFTNKNNFLVYSFAEKKVQFIIPFVLLPQKRNVVSVDAIVYLASDRKAANAPDAKKAAATPSEVDRLLPALICGLDDRSIMTLDLAGNTVISCKQVSSDDKKDPKRLGITKVITVGENDSTKNTCEPAVIAEDGLDEEAVNTRSGRRNQRMTAADFSHVLHNDSNVVLVNKNNGNGSKRPFFTNSHVALEVLFRRHQQQELSSSPAPSPVLRMAISESTKQLVVESIVEASIAAQAVGLMKFAMKCPLGRPLFGFDLKVDPLTGQVLVRRQIYNEGNNNADLPFEPLVAETYSPHPFPNGEVQVPVGLRFTYDAHGGIVSWHIVYSIRPLKEPLPESSTAPAASSLSAAAAPTSPVVAEQSPSSSSPTIERSVSSENAAEEADRQQQQEGEEQVSSMPSSPTTQAAATIQFIDGPENDTAMFPKALGYSAAHQVSEAALWPGNPQLPSAEHYVSPPDAFSLVLQTFEFTAVDEDHHQQQLQAVREKTLSVAAVVESIELVDGATSDAVRYLKPHPKQQQEEEEESTKSSSSDGVILFVGDCTLVFAPLMDLLSTAGSSLSQSKVLSLPLTIPKVAWKELLYDESRDTLASTIVDAQLVPVDDQKMAACASASGLSSVTSASNGEKQVPCIALLLRDPAHILVLDAKTMAVVASIALPKSAAFNPLALAARWCCNQLHFYVVSNDLSVDGGMYLPPAVDHLVLEPTDAEERAAIAAKGERFVQLYTSSWHAMGMRRVNPFCSEENHRLSAVDVISHHGKNNADSASAKIITSKDMMHYLPPRDDNLAATQKEQGFFKRLVTTSWSAQVGKVESLLEPLHVETFDDFTSRVVTEDAVARMSDKRGQAHFDPATEREELLGMRARTAGGGGGGGGAEGRHAAAKGAMSQTKNTMNENLELLNERGQKIGRLEQKMQEINEEADEFQRLCKELRRKEEKSWF